MTNQKFFVRMALAVVLASPISGFSAEPSPPLARGVGRNLDHGVLRVTSTSTAPPSRGVGRNLDHGVLRSQSGIQVKKWDTLGTTLIQVTGEAAVELYEAIQDPIESDEGFRRGENVTCAITADGAICEMEMSGRGVIAPARDIR